MKYVLLLLAVWILAADVHGQDAPVSLSRGFVSGNQYRGLSEVAKNGYVMGLLDGFQFSPIFDGNQRRIDALNECLGTSRSDQWMTLLDNYLTQHPERWHWGAHVLMYNALREVCPGIE